MKTTIDIADSLFERLRQKAGRERTTMRALVESALRQFLGAPSGKPKSFRLRDGSYRGRGTEVGVEEGNWASLADDIYEGRGGTVGRRRR